MPELPEVETIVRQLKPALIGEVLGSLTSHWHKTVEISDLELKTLYGKEIQGIQRRGKWILIMFPNQLQIVIHLRMTGQLSLKFQKEKQKHLRCTFTFHSGKSLFFYDSRKFGRIILNIPEKRDRLKHVGVDALDDDSLRKTLRTLQSRRAVKTVLLDQTVIAGIGNIYADEALFEAGIHPRTPFLELDYHKRTLLCDAIRHILRQAIENGGSTISDYRNLEGERGVQQHRHQVYHRTNQACLRCQSAIMRTVIGSRSAHYCPRCQPQTACMRKKT